MPQLLGDKAPAAAALYDDGAVSADVTHYGQHADMAKNVGLMEQALAERRPIGHAPTSPSG
jgi:hypothetical protein